MENKKYIEPIPMSRLPVPLQMCYCFDAYLDFAINELHFTEPMVQDLKDECNDLFRQASGKAVDIFTGKDLT